jgi:hypothetical protein
MEDDFDIDKETFDRLMEHYVDIGAISVNGIDKEGNFIYLVTDAAEILAPGLWEAHHAMVDEALLNLFDQGLIDVEYDEELNAKMRISDDAKKVMYKLGYVDMEVLDDPRDER